MKVLEPQSQCAKELAEIENVDTIIVEEIEKICNTATLAEITKVLYLMTRTKRTSGPKKETIKSNLKKIAKELVGRVEAESGRLRLPELCRHLLWEL